MPIEHGSGRCYRCLRPRSRCYCSRITPLATRTRFALCVHPNEYRHQKCGTGRLCGIALSRAELFVGVDLSDHAGLNRLLGDPTLSPWLLYPGAGATNLSSGVPLLLPPNRDLLVVILDGTWHEARKILHRSPNLRSLPRMAFTPGFRSRFSIKRQPHPWCLSTIEAVHELLGALEISGYEQLGEARGSLLEILADLVSWQASHQAPGRARRSLNDASVNVDGLPTAFTHVSSPA
jgi:DTW domain-containing protein YfiP